MKSGQLCDERIPCSSQKQELYAENWFGKNNRLQARNTLNMARMPVAIEGVSGKCCATQKEGKKMDKIGMLSGGCKPLPQFGQNWKRTSGTKTLTGAAGDHRVTHDPEAAGIQTELYKLRSNLA